MGNDVSKLAKLSQKAKVNDTLGKSVTKPGAQNLLQNIKTQQGGQPNNTSGS